MSVITISGPAALAIRAAHIRKTCGRFAAAGFVRNNNVDARLYRLACQLAAVSA